MLVLVIAEVIMKLRISLSQLVKLNGEDRKCLPPVPLMPA